MKAKAPFRRLGLEIRRDIANLECHQKLPLQASPFAG
jgi:hypothetical protein